MIYVEEKTRRGRWSVTKVDQLFTAWNCHDTKGNLSYLILIHTSYMNHIGHPAHSYGWSPTICTLDMVLPKLYCNWYSDRSHIMENSGQPYILHCANHIWKNAQLIIFTRKNGIAYSYPKQSLHHFKLPHPQTICLQTWIKQVTTWPRSTPFLLIILGSYDGN